MGGGVSSLANDGADRPGVVERPWTGPPRWWRILSAADYGVARAVSRPLGSNGAGAGPSVH